jgi:hypothetical protein
VVEVALIVAGGVLARSPSWPPRADRCTAAARSRVRGARVLTGLSITWAVQPDDAWLETNRTLGLPRRLRGGHRARPPGSGRWGALLGATVVAATLVSLFALATKVFPGA